MIAKLLCWWYGHKRGKRISVTRVQCPRCGAEWLRLKTHGTTTVPADNTIPQKTEVEQFP